LNNKIWRGIGAWQDNESRDDADNCPALANPDQKGIDRDGHGDICNLNNDNDDITEGLDTCPLVANPDQIDTDTDRIGAARDNCSFCKEVSPGGHRS